MVTPRLPAGPRETSRTGHRGEAGRRPGPDESHHTGEEAATTGPGFTGPTWRRAAAENE